MKKKLTPAEQGIALAENALGRAVAEVLHQGKEPDRASLTAHLEQQLSLTLSAQGRLAPEHDIMLGALQAALALLAPADRAG